MKRKQFNYRRITTLLLLTALSVNLTLPAPHASAAKIKLNKTKLKLTVGKTYKLKISKKKGKIKWTSSKKKVATVTSKGVVKAKKAGTATITAQMKGKKYKCKVTVKKSAKNTVTATKKVTTTKAAATKLPSGAVNVPSAVPDPTPMVIPTPIPPTPTPNTGNPESPTPTPTSSVSETPAPGSNEPSELSKNITLEYEILSSSILIKVTNNNSVWVNSITVDYSFSDIEQNNIAAEEKTTPPMKPGETIYLTITQIDSIDTIDRDTIELSAEAEEADSETNYLDINTTEDITLTDEFSVTPTPLLALNLVNHTRYDTSICYTVFFRDDEQTIMDAYSDKVELTAKGTDFQSIELPLDEAIGSPLYTDYEIVCTAHGTETLDADTPYINKINVDSAKKQTTDYAVLIPVENKNTIWLNSVNLEYQLYDSEDQFLGSRQLSLLSMKPNETQWVTITVDPEEEEPDFIEKIDWDQSYVNITVDADSSDYTYSTTTKVTATTPVKIEDENIFEFTITNTETEAYTDGSYVARFYNGSKVISAEYGTYMLMPEDEETISLSGPVSYDETETPIYATSCKVTFYAKHKQL